MRERLRSMERRELFGLVAIAILVVAGAAFWYARSLPGRVSVELASGGAREPNGSAFGASPSPSPASILVYVTGWVRKPGVYQLGQGDRVIDAIRLAGGAKHGADLASVNLAAQFWLPWGETIPTLRTPPRLGENWWLTRPAP